MPSLEAVPGSSHLAWHLCFFAEGGLLYQLRGLTQVFSRPGNEEGGQDACGPHPLEKGSSRWGGTLSPHLGRVRPPPTGPDASQGTMATIMKANSGSDSDCVHFTRPLEGGVQGLHAQQGPAEENRNWHASFRPSPLANRGSKPGTSQDQRIRVWQGPRPPAQFPLQQPSRCLPSTVRKVTHSAHVGDAHTEHRLPRKVPEHVGTVPPLAPLGGCQEGPALPPPHAEDAPGPTIGQSSC